ncbi:beta-ketoacyl synthase [bacterium (Candidatus Blackallbacteria) CG17_big_fil_post_rev_8_21_14_2_50_48_46]|uniref:Beta-ketoacyl synthase n=1 Tax=bacterium (Candidatus Blackallbacteria) CG17_big_fil_post_rev_8_21_14_2_50_48_46 TaxID=2014261 RepID=A0A2M7G6I0_9BACT|nr:MAG: beta-ketoacyl synthase [bacterium (Candidatus Blackallbacteria) CG18_big_fil_WC_8_21_14_2_50_49_26]PIW17513.1 MAG: beta-ketoacyl synthase [bacterium (Candidatus Blackallbacteria) CG17_big_fil_post_rev_8_21_14_2_50_48_46]PIW48367.1 MAG: beta-ketoacyl synthase [bacterium (Candidatus Blackallbacteria) CG13_big_fil_rev_8_21_14_2_50_49_14]
MHLEIPPPAQNFVELLRWRAQTHPDLMALGWFENGESLTASYSYLELDLQAKIWAQNLRLRHGAGARILLVFPPGLEFMAAFAGCLYAGMVPVPAYPPEPHRLEHSLRRLLAIIADAESEAVLTLPAFYQQAMQLLQASGQASLQSLNWLTPASLQPELAQAWFPPQLEPEDLAFLQYTSGSTGVPKGVMISHGNLLANMEMIKTAFEHGERENTLVCWVPFYHDMGLVGHLLQSLYIGGKTLIMSPLDFLRKPLRWLKLISEWKATSTGAPNFAFELCVRKIKPEERDQLDLSSLRLVLNGAEPVQYKTLMRFLDYFEPAGFPRDAIYPAYGMAEATVFISGSLRSKRPVCLAVSRTAFENNRIETAQEDSHEAMMLVGSGQVWGEEKLKIVNPQSRQPLAENQVGEIWLRGPHIAQGYWRRAEETQAAFQAHLDDGSAETWLRTGDLGFQKAGELYVTGRLKDLIIIRGRNLYPHDLERCIDSLRPRFPVIRPGCGVAVALEGEATESLGLVQEISQPFEACEDLALAISSAIEAEFEVSPRKIIFLAPGSLPKTSSGKLMRQACKAELKKSKPGWEVVYQWPATQPLQTPPTLPSFSQSAELPKSELEAWIRQWLATELTGTLESFSIETPLQALGLDSALAVRLHADLEEKLNRKLIPSLLWDFPNLKQLVPALLSPADHAPVPSRKAQQEPIAILGMSCRFPGESQDPESYWKTLNQNHDALCSPPLERFEESKGLLRGGYLNEVAGFDAEFFGISAREAESMDPQQRILLELVWEALEQAGILPTSLEGSETGIFVALSGSDYAQRSLFGGPQSRDGTSVTGSAFSVAAGRIAYLLGTEGPALTIDTACSSSLTAIHQACQSLRNGEISMAIVAGVNLILSEDLTQAFVQANALSPEGECRSFSAQANGYVRSEGGAALILKRLDEHQASQEPLWGIIKASAVNHDGRSQGLTAPNGRSQQKLLKQALELAGLHPHQIGFLEAHGTGTPLGDPIEVNAIHAVYGERPADQPLWIGAAKSVVGHLEAAAGMAGLLKTLLVLQKGIIPANLKGLPLNPRLLNYLGPLQFPQQAQTWSAPEPRRAALSSFGISGSNAHLILEQAPALPQPNSPGPWLFQLSADSSEQVKDYAQKLQNSLSAEPPLAQLASSLSQRRTRPWRWAGVAADLQSLNEALAHVEPREAKTAPKWVWVFPGQGGQWQGMGSELLQNEPIFAKAFAACSEAFRPWFPEGLENLLQSWQSDKIAEIQPLLCAWQIAMGRLLMAWGLIPSAMIGHSMGEVAAAHLAGMLSLEDAARIIAERSRLMQSLPPGQSMLLTDMSWNEAQDWEKEGLVRAVSNGPNQTVMAGPTTDLNVLQAQLEAQERLARPVAVSMASHSPQVDALLPEIENTLTSIETKVGQVPLFSTVTAEILSGPELKAPYWAQNLRQPVLFYQAFQKANQAGFAHFLEISPHALLSPVLREQGVFACALGRRNQAEKENLLHSLAEVWCQGSDLNGRALQPKFPPLPLPPSPWNHQNYWLEPPISPEPLRVQPTAQPKQTGENWQPLSPPKGPPPQSCLLTGGSDTLRKTLALLLESQGIPCVHLRQAEVLASLPEGWQLNFQSTQEWQVLAKNLPELPTRGYRVLLWLESLSDSLLWPSVDALEGLESTQIWIPIQAKSMDLSTFSWPAAAQDWPESWSKLALENLSNHNLGKLASILRLNTPAELVIQASQVWKKSLYPLKTSSVIESAPSLVKELKQETLQAQIAEMLRIPLSKINPDTPLDSLGFDSLLAVEFRSRLEKLSGRDIPPELLRRSITLAEIMTWLKRAS